MGTMLAKDAVTFSEENLPEMGLDHNNALFITRKCRGNIVSKVLIDGGSGVNILSLAVVQQLGLTEDDYPPSSLHIRAFDGARRQAVGEAHLDITMGPATFSATF